MLIGIFNPLGAQTDRLRCEVCQNLILRPMNTGLLRYAVATAPTVYGIETVSPSNVKELQASSLQQHLPFTVLKPNVARTAIRLRGIVATAPTVYGIETHRLLWLYKPCCCTKVATAPTVYGIETG